MRLGRVVTCLGISCWALACAFASTATVPNSTQRPASPTYRLVPAGTQADVTPVPTWTPSATPTRVATVTPPATATALPDYPLERARPAGLDLVPVMAMSATLGGADRWLQAAPDGTLWYMTNRDAVELVAGTWITHLQEVSGVLVGRDDDGRIWYANDDASEIAAWQDDRWITYTATEGWDPLPATYYAPVARGVVVDGGGRVWLRTVQDVRFLDEATWQVITREQMGLTPPGDEGYRTDFELVAIHEGVEMWVGECDWGGPGPFDGQGVRWTDGTVWQGAEAPLDGACVTAIDEASDGAVWVGADTGLWRFDPVARSWQSLPLPDPPDGFSRYGFFKDMLVDASGDVWAILAPCGGASCYSGYVPYRMSDDVWTQLAPRDEQYVPWLLRGADRRDWLVWAGAVYHIGGGSIDLVARLPVHQASADGAGRLWVIAWFDGHDTLFMFEP